MKRKSVKNVLKAAVLCALVSFFLPVSAGAVSESNLEQLLRDQGHLPILKTWYDDFDGDGVYEMFAALGYGETESSLWFAGDKQVSNLYITGGYVYYMDYHNPQGVCEVSDKQKLFVIESGAGGSGSRSHCYYVKNGKVKTVAKAGEGLRHLGGNQFAVHPSAFDRYVDDSGIGTGHTYKRYYLKWTGTKFKEYKGTKISQKKLKKYSGASAILKRAKREGYSIGTIYRRGNGIINVNLYKTDAYGNRTNENLTLQISGKRVSLVVMDANASHWISRYTSGFGGVYKKSGF